MIIHQIFGFLGDDMPELFIINSDKIKEWCFKNNYKYILWNKSMCDIFLEENYESYKELYYNVKYPIMKVDIIRFLILHKYGGLYIDMDCIPNIDKVNENEFRIAYKHGLKRKHYEMEILQSYPDNRYLLEFIDYIKKQIIEKDNIEIYNTWKARYVYQTTGPYSLSRFIKINKLSSLIKKYIINEPKLKDKSLNLTGDEDFISYPSCSYLDASSSYSKINDIN